MHSYNFMTFESSVNAFLQQKEHKIAPLVRDAHEMLLLSATKETDWEQLASGIYRLLYYLPQGAALHQWLAMLGRTVLKTESPLIAIQRDTSFGWLLLLNDKPELAEIAYRDAYAQLETFSLTASSPAMLPLIRRIQIDIAIGEMFLLAERQPTRVDVTSAAGIWNDHLRFCTPEQEKRLALALASLKFGAGMIEACHASASHAYYFFAQRAMCAEAGLAAYYLALCTAAEVNMDLADADPNGDASASRWLNIAARLWSSISLPLGQALIEPYAHQLGDMPPPRPSRRNRQLNPPARIFN